MVEFANASDVTGVSGALTAEQTAAIPGLIAQASTLLRGWGLERGVNVDALAEDSVRAEIAKVAVVNAVKRALGVLDGDLERTVSIDDYRETTRRSPEQLAAGIFIDPTDLRGFLPGKRSRWGTIRLGTAL